MRDIDAVVVVAIERRERVRRERAGRRMWSLAGALAAAVTIGLMLATGCAQNTEAGIRQTTPQQSGAPTSSEQAAPTLGSDVTVRVSVINAPGSSTTAGGEGEGDPIAAAIEGLATTQGAGAAGASRLGAGYAQAGVHVPIHIVTGGTSPAQTGSASSSATAAQSPSGSTQANPTQDIRPNVPITISLGDEAIGRIAAAVAAAVAGGGPTTQPAISVR